MLKRIAGYIFLATVMVIMAISVTCVEKTEKPKTATSIFDNAKIIDLKSGAGKVSVIETYSAFVPPEVLGNWYFNYVKPNVGDNGAKWKWAVIVYKDHKNKGTFCSSELVMNKNASVKKDLDDGSWHLVGKAEELLVEDENAPGHLKTVATK